MPAATYSVPFGATNLTVSGAFPSTYGLLAQAIGAWAPVIAEVFAGPGGFTLGFSVPAPANAFVDVFTSFITTTPTTGSVTLADYLADTRRFLRDEGVSNHLYSDTDLIAFINRAMQQRDLDLGMNRVRISTPMVLNQYDYPISQILSGTVLDGPVASFAAQAGTVAVPPGAFTVSVPGVFPTVPYQLVCTPIGAWAPVITTISKTSTGFDVAFSVPAPVSGASFSWIASSGGPTNAIIATQTVNAGDVSATLSGAFGVSGFPIVATPIGAWAPVITVVSTTPTSAIVSFSVPAPVSGASFSWVAAGLSAGNVRIIDMLSIIITPLGAPPGGTRYPLARWPYTRLGYLLSTSYPTYPVSYAWYGTKNIMVAPPPANPYPTEFDMSVFAPPLVNLTDTDPLTYPYTDPVPFLAAQFAKLGAQRFDEADSFMKVFDNRLNRVRARGRPFGVATPFFDLPRGAR